MKRIIIFLITSAIAISLLNACGPSEEEIERREQARQDSLEQVRQQRLAQQRQDSIEQARQDSIEAAKKEEERNRIEFASDGEFSVQVEAWRSEEKAQNEVQKWMDRGYENAYVVKYGNEDTGDVWFRVRLGHLATRDMAEKLRTKLQEEFNEPSWISLTGDGQTTTASGDEVQAEE